MSAQRRLTTSVVLAASAGVVALVNPGVAVFGVIVAANLTLGRREDVPFSTYGMFSNPSARSWALTFEDAHGNLFPVATIGILPSSVRKCYSQSLRGPDGGRTQACDAVMDMIEAKRPKLGRWANEPITILRMDYELVAGEVVTTRNIIGVSQPR